MNKDLLLGTLRGVTEAGCHPLLLLASWLLPGRRMRLVFLRLSLLAILAAAIQLAPDRAQASHCGGENQRACCLLERHPGEGACQDGLVEKGHAFCLDARADDDCFCGGAPNVGAGICVRITACGGEGQRSCCGSDPGQTRCDDGLTVQGDCWDGTRNDESNIPCACDNAVPRNNVSPGICEVPDCGEEGERGCCVGDERTLWDGSACAPGLFELAGCSGDCACSDGGSSSGTCIDLTPCGGEGQRDCCSNVQEGIGADCRPGDDPDYPLVSIPGCGPDSSSCKCAGIGTSRRTCVQPTPCGGPGQRSCCDDEPRGEALGGPCEPDLVWIDGCVGDCFCANNKESDGTCTVLDSSTLYFSEPTIGWTPPATERSCSLLGYADIHAHHMSHLAHGGTVHYGQPAPIDPATGEFTQDRDIRTAFNPDVDRRMHGIHDRPGLVSGDRPWDPIGNGTQDFTADAVRHRGFPEFNSIPHWTSTTHQKMYYRWLERAYRGGLRLMVQLTVTNEALCIVQAGENCDDSMEAVDKQIVATYDFERFIEELDDVPGNGWYRIVTDPLEARQVIANGKMAVVLGIEMDNLFNCKEENDPDNPRPCPRVSPKTADECLALAPEEGEPDLRRPLPLTEGEEPTLSEVVDWYHDCFGIRHVFPVHNFDNAFGATATWQDSINVGQRAAIGRWQNAPFPCEGGLECASDDDVTCEDQGAEGYGFDFHQAILGIIAGVGFDDLTPIPEYPGVSVCNTRGLNLTEDDRDPRGLGGELLNALMDTGMIIDVDHLSNKSFNDMVDFTRDRFPETGYPLVASHVQSFDLHQQDYPGGNIFGRPILNVGRHERMRTLAQLQAIRDSGGMIAAMGKDDAQDTDSSGFEVQNPYQGLLATQPIADDCRHSSKSFGQAYQYAVDTMRAPVAFGLDMNGVAGNVGPRYGSSGCGNLFDKLVERDARRDERSSQIRSSKRLRSSFTLDGFGTFERQRSGTKAEDDPLGCFEDTCPAGLDCETECTDLRTWDFNTDGLTHVGLVPDLVADLKLIGLGQPYVDALFGSAEEYIRVWERSEEVGTGKTPEYLDLDETESAALSCPPVALCFEEDETPPEITCPAHRAEECTGQSPTRVFDLPEAEDACSAIQSRDCDRQFFRLGSHTDTCSAVDTAGNEATCEREVTIFDANVPTITAPADLPPVECTSQSGASPALGVASASDLCDPSPGVSNDAPSVLPLGKTTVAWTATDSSGNVSQAFQSVEVVDTTPPSNSCPADVTIECDESRDPSNTGEGTASDICDSAPEVASSDAEVAGACADESVITRTWSATDAAGNAADDCDQTITIADTTAPVIACNAPATIDPTGGLDEDEPLATPISFTATAPDNCDPNATIEIIGFDCFALTRTGRRIDKTEDGCVTAIDGDTFTILDSGGVGDTITWTVRATDRCGEVSETVCEVGVVGPTVEL